MGRLRTGGAEVVQGFAGAVLAGGAVRRAAKVDANQEQIVSALRAAGISVVSLASLGRGVPDILAAKEGEAWLIEIKGPKGTLTPDQMAWISNWRGVVHVIRTPDEALRLVGALSE